MKITIFTQDKDIVERKCIEKHFSANSSETVYSGKWNSRSDIYEVPNYETHCPIWNSDYYFKSYHRSNLNSGFGDGSWIYPAEPLFLEKENFSFGYTNDDAIVITLARSGTFMLEEILRGRYTNVLNHKVVGKLHEITSNGAKLKKDIDVYYLYRENWLDWATSTRIGFHAKQHNPEAKGFYHQRDNFDYSNLPLIPKNDHMIGSFTDFLASSFNSWCNLRFCNPSANFYLTKYEYITKNYTTKIEKPISYKKKKSDFFEDWELFKNQIEEQITVWNMFRDSTILHLKSMNVRDFV